MRSWRKKALLMENAESGVCKKAALKTSIYGEKSMRLKLVHTNSDNESC